MAVDRIFRGLYGVLMFQGSMAGLGGSLGSPIALALSVAAEGLSTSDDGCLYSGAEPDGDVSPDTLFWLIPLPRVNICQQSDTRFNASAPKLMRCLPPQ